MTPITCNLPIVGRVDKAMMWFWSKPCKLWNHITGRDNFTLAIGSFWLSAGLFSLAHVIGMMHKTTPGKVFWTAIWTIFNCVLGWWWTSYFRSLRRLTETEAPILSTSLITVFFVRLFLVYSVLGILLTISMDHSLKALTNDAGTICMQGACYFATCLIPRRKSWAAETAKKLKGALARAASWRPSMPPMPVPIPVGR